MNKKSITEPIYEPINDPITVPERADKYLRDKIYELEKQIKELERYRKYEECANETKAIFDSYVSAGFTEDQAFTLLLKAFESTMGGKR